MAILLQNGKKARNMNPLHCRLGIKILVPEQLKKQIAHLIVPKLWTKEIVKIMVIVIHSRTEIRTKNAGEPNLLLLESFSLLEQCFNLHFFQAT